MNMAIYYYIDKNVCRVRAGPIIKTTPGATHGKRESRELCNTLLGYIYKQQIVEFTLLHSKNALEMIS